MTRFLIGATKSLESFDGHEHRLVEAVGIFPGEVTSLHLDGAILLEFEDDWQIGRFYRLVIQIVHLYRHNSNCGKVVPKTSVHDSTVGLSICMVLYQLMNDLKPNYRKILALSWFLRIYR
jgi:hypothetical protein